jgi:hypothetical protein
MLIDIMDNFESLNRFILIGGTKYQARIEKLFGYLCGFIFIAIGIRSWIPSVIELQNKRKEELKKLRKRSKYCPDYCRSVPVARKSGTIKDIGSRSNPI